MADDQDDSQKTEEPTRKRLEEAENRGQIASSKEIGNFLTIFAFLMLLITVGPFMMDSSKSLIRGYIEHPDMLPMDEGNLARVLIDVFSHALLILLIPFALFIMLALAAGFAQNKFKFSATPLSPELEKISPLKGLKRLFSVRSVVEMLKGLIKILIVAGVSAYVLMPHSGHIVQLPDSELSSTIAFTYMVVKKMLIGICVTLFFIAIIDFLYQRYEYIKGLRMSKQEIKDEYKQQEGDPHVKSRIRSIRMERARKRMMAEVPKADVVITNPTHYAVALKYDAAKMKAPTLIAKGADNIALKMREIAKENDIPIVENPPLARILFETTDIDKEIPFEHYKGVAEVIGYVYKLKGKTRAK